MFLFYTKYIVLTEDFYYSEELAYPTTLSFTIWSKKSSQRTIIKIQVTG